ncbi:hypothetical protein B0H13DRAFT_2333803 [Mycena leptocephala]|nr:hypothetical protein B0H13DRAFT_2333803 [Mycena leptocephala]
MSIISTCWRTIVSPTLRGRKRLKREKAAAIADKQANALAKKKEQEAHKAAKKVEREQKKLEKEAENQCTREERAQKKAEAEKDGQSTSTARRHTRNSAPTTNEPDAPDSPQEQQSTTPVTSMDYGEVPPTASTGGHTLVPEGEMQAPPAAHALAEEGKEPNTRTSIALGHAFQNACYLNAPQVMLFKMPAI